MKDYTDIEISVLHLQDEDIVTASGGLLDNITGDDGSYGFDDLFGNN